MTTTRIPNVFGQSEKQTFVPHRLPFSKIAIAGGEISKRPIQTKDGDFGTKIVLGDQILYYFPLRGGHCVRRWFYTQDQLGVDVKLSVSPSEDNEQQKLVMNADDILQHLVTNGTQLQGTETFAFVGKLDVLHEQSFPGRSTTNWALHVRERVQFAPTPASFLRQVPYVVMPIKENNVKSFDEFDILGYILKIGTDQVFVSQARLDAFQHYKAQLENEIQSESITFSMDVLHYEITHAVYRKQSTPSIREVGEAESNDYAWTTFSSGRSDTNSIQRGYHHVRQLWAKHDAMSSLQMDNANLRRALCRADSHTMTFVNLMQAMSSILASPPQEYYGHAPSMLTTFQSVYSLEYDLKRERLPATFVKKTEEFGRRGFPIDDQLRVFLRELIGEFSQQPTLRISGGASSDEHKLKGMMIFIKAFYFKLGQVLKETPSGVIEPLNSQVEEIESSDEFNSGADESSSDIEDDIPTESRVRGVIGTAKRMIKPLLVVASTSNMAMYAIVPIGGLAAGISYSHVASWYNDVQDNDLNGLVNDTDKIDPLTIKTGKNALNDSTTVFVDVTSYPVNESQMCWPNDTSSIVVHNGTIVATMADSADAVTGIVTAPVVEIDETQFNPQQLNFSDVETFFNSSVLPKFDFVRVAAFVQALDPDYYYSQLGTPIWEIWHQQSFHYITDPREQWLSELGNIKRVLVSENHKQDTHKILAEFNISLNADETFPTLVYPITEISIPVYLAITILRKRNDKTHTEVIYNLARVLRAVNTYKVCARDWNEIEDKTSTVPLDMFDSILTNPSELYGACTSTVHTPKFSRINNYIETMLSPMPLNNIETVNSTWYPLLRDGVIKQIQDILSISGGGSGKQFAWSTQSLAPLLANLMLKIQQTPTSENARQWVNVIMQAQRMLRFGRQSKFPGIFGVYKQKKRS